MRKCSYCKHNLDSDEMFCQFCGESLGSIEREQWYFKSIFLVVVFVLVGPIAVPLIFSNPRYSGSLKVKISLVFSVIWILIFCIVFWRFQHTTSLVNAL